MNTIKTEFLREWTVVYVLGGGEPAHANRGRKAATYRLCRRMNGKRACGQRLYKVQRVMA